MGKVIQSCQNKVNDTLKASNLKGIIDQARLRKLFLISGIGIFVFLKYYFVKIFPKLA